MNACNNKQHCHSPTRSPLLCLRLNFSFDTLGMFTLFVGGGTGHIQYTVCSSSLSGPFACTTAHLGVCLSCVCVCV